MTRSRPGWLSVYPTPGQLDLVWVEDGQPKPHVKRLASLATGEGLVAVLARLRKELQLAGYANVMLLNSGDYQLLQVDAPAVPRPEWKDALRWKLKDLLEYGAEEAVFDMLDIPTEQHAPNRPRSAYVVATRRSVVAGHIAPLSAAKVPLAVVDIPEMGQRNIAALFEEENRGLACLAFDAASLILTVTFQGELYASRRIDVSLAQLSAADPERRAMLFERIGLEAQRTLDAFDRQYGFMTVSKVMVAVPPGIDGLLEALANSIYLPLQRLDLGQVIAFDEAFADAAEQLRLLHVIGVALRRGAAA